MHSQFRKQWISILLLACLLGGTVMAVASARGQVLDAFGEALTPETVAELGLGGQAEEALAAGQNLPLAIDAMLQKAAERAMVEKCASSPAAAVVVMDMQGRVLAMADHQRGGVPQAISASGVPGYTLRPLAVLAALAAGHLHPEETISEEGLFDQYDRENPLTCWIAPEQRYRHQHQSYPNALANGCDFFFYTIGERLGVEGLAELGRAMGLEGPSGLGLDGEEMGILAGPKALYNPDLPLDQQETACPAQVQAALVAHLREQAIAGGVTVTEDALVACANALMRMAVENSQTEWVSLIREVSGQQLGLPQAVLLTKALIEPVYDQLSRIRWGGNQTALAAAGWSLTRVTPIAMARYWAALGNGGYLYPASLLRKDAYAPVADFSGRLGVYLPMLQEGLRGWVDVTGESAKALRGWDFRDDIAGMTSTAKGESGPATWATTLFPWNEPEIAVAVLIGEEDKTATATRIMMQMVDEYVKK